MRTLEHIIVICLLATVASAQELTWAELTGRPELWPAQCALKEAIKFEGGVTVPAAQPLTVLAVKANEVELSTADGRTTFTAEPDETDALAVARAAYTSLTPKQRALTYPSLTQRKELWPYRVTLTRAIDFGGGKSLPAGTQVQLKEVQPGKLLVVAEKFNALFNVYPPATDLMAQARAFVETTQGVSPRFTEEQLALEAGKAAAAKQKAEGRVVTELKGKLINARTGQPEPLNPDSLPRYLVFLRGSTTCSITRGFLPKFITYCREMKPTHPEFEVIYLTVDSMEDTEKFAKELGFSWRAVTYENTTMPSVNPHIDGRMPQLIVMDRYGRVLANGLQATAPAALQQLDAILKSPANHS